MLFDADTWARIFRWIHIGAGGAWLGEVVVVVFVLVPTVVRSDKERRGWMLASIFPRIFRLVSVLSLTTVIAGAALFLASGNWQLDLGRFATGRWGWSILIGGVLGLALTVFHFVAESRLEPLALSATSDDFDDELLVQRLRIIPRVGLGILIVVFGLMMYAARGV